MAGEGAISAGAVHALFDGRDACPFVTFDHIVSSASLRALDACDGKQSWHEQISAGLPALLGFLDEHPQMARFAIVERLGATPALLRRRSEAVDKLVAVVDAGRHEAPPGLAPPPEVAERLVGTVLSVIHESLLSGSRVPLAALAPPLTSLIVLPYLGEDAARSELARFARPLCMAK